MTKAQALRLARARWGADAWVLLDPGAPIGDERAKLAADLKAHRAAKPQQPARMTPEWKAWRDRESDLENSLLRDRCRVGNRFGIPGYFTGRSVQGFGETWEQACTRAGLVPKPDA